MGERCREKKKQRPPAPADSAAPPPATAPPRRPGSRRPHVHFGVMPAYPPHSIAGPLPALTWLVGPGLEGAARVRGVARKRRARRPVTKPGSIKGDRVLVPAAAAATRGQVDGRPVAGGLGGRVPDGGIHKQAQQGKGEDAGEPGGGRRGPGRGGRRGRGHGGGVVPPPLLSGLRRGVAGRAWPGPGWPERERVGGRGGGRPRREMQTGGKRREKKKALWAPSPLSLSHPTLPLFSRPQLNGRRKNYTHL